MPMGVACTMSIFRLIMTKTLREFDVLVYVNEILVLRREHKSTFDHLVKVEQVLQQKNVEFLGYQLTSTGIGPHPKKIKAMYRT